jgi:ABC-type uncharacterized transport system auxiliary subunit
VKRSIAFVVLLGLAGCGGTFTSRAPVSHAYVLRPPAVAAPAASRLAVSVRVARPAAGPGLDTDRILLLTPDARLDFYAGGHWATSIPSLVGALATETLRDSGAFEAVYGESATFPADHLLFITVRRFEAEAPSDGVAPTARVVLDCSLGVRTGDGAVATFRVTGEAQASTNRLGAIVAAHQAAINDALSALAIEVPRRVGQNPIGQNPIGQNVETPVASMMR